MPRAVDNVASPMGSCFFLPLNSFDFDYATGEHEKLEQQSNQGGNHPQKDRVIPPKWGLWSRFGCHHSSAKNGRPSLWIKQDGI